MAKITYTTKIDNQTSALPAINKVAAADLNEIKTSVNAAYDKFGGFAFYEDATTSGTPINLTADTWTDLTNDKAGTGTISNLPSYDGKFEIVPVPALSFVKSVQVSAVKLIGVPLVVASS